eukprot:Awhi_evm1s4464
MKFFLSSLPLVGVASASYDIKYYPEVKEYSYDCVSVNPRSTDKWCKVNCLALNGSFNKHPACFISSYSNKNVHNVCKCSKVAWPYFWFF